jgi:hypothetical protein
MQRTSERGVVMIVPGLKAETILEILPVCPVGDTLSDEGGDPALDIGNG